MVVVVSSSWPLFSLALFLLSSSSLLPAATLPGSYFGFVFLFVDVTCSTSGSSGFFSEGGGTVALSSFVFILFSIHNFSSTCQDPAKFLMKFLIKLFTSTCHGLRAGGQVLGSQAGYTGKGHDFHISNLIYRRSW